MQQPQVLLFGIEGKLADVVRTVAQEHAVAARDVRHASACLHLLRRGGPGVLVLKVGRDLEQELGLLGQVAQLFPETASLVLGGNDNPALAGLLWELGATYVLFPPEPIEWLPEILGRFLPAKSAST